MPELSSASSLLHGFRYRGKKIDTVSKHKGTRRVIHYADGSKESVHRRQVHEMAKLRGFLHYQQRYKKASGLNKRQMLRKSTNRQHSILRNYIARTTQEMAAMPRAAKKLVSEHLKRIQQQHFGSPLAGRRPASSLIAARPGMTHQVAKHAGIKLKMARKRKRIVK